MGSRVVNWVQAFLEVGLVLLGLLLAFSADRAWEARQEARLAQSYVDRLRSDFAQSRQALDATAESHRDIVRAAHEFLAAVASQDETRIRSEAPPLIHRIFDGSTTSLVTGTLDEMKSTGRLDLLDEDVRSALAAFDGMRFGSFAITEQAEVLQWIQRQPYLNEHIGSDLFVGPEDKARWGVPDSPFPDRTIAAVSARELWNVVVYRIIYAEFRLGVIGEMQDLSDQVTVALSSM